jgi:GT2 family glycosyltransferase
MRDDVGVVVIGRNEGERLVACLQSIKRDAATMVYVDSGSSDNSVGAAEKIGASVVTLDMSRPFTAARARNEGFAALKSFRPHVHFVQFVDGDCTLTEGWLSKAFAFLSEHPNVAVVCGRRRERFPTASVYNQICDLEWNTPVGEAAACGGDSLVRVEAFEAVGGFRPQLIAGEEPELCLRLREKGWKVWRLDAEMTRHDAAISRFAQWWLRCVRCGYGYAEVARMHRVSPFVIWTREERRAIVWGGVLPAAILAGALVNPAFLAFSVVYPLQIVRIAYSRRIASSQSWAYAVLITVAKFAEYQGILKFHWRRSRGRISTLIEYK